MKLSTPRVTYLLGTRLCRILMKQAPPAWLSATEVKHTACLASASAAALRTIERAVTEMQAYFVRCSNVDV